MEETASTLLGKVSIAMPVAEHMSNEQNALQDRINRVHYCECCGAPYIWVPTIVCAHCDDEIAVHAYVYKHRGLFYAECLTFNLLSRGATQEEAIIRLQGTLYTYLDTVLAEGKSTKGLIPRRAPLASWLRFYYARIVARVAYVLGQRYPLATKAYSPHVDEFRVAHC